MSKLDLYYRAFKDYRKTTKNSADTLNERKLIISNNPEMDFFTSTKFICHIEEDWVERIEEGLKFVTKAIEEERQFIRVQGDTVPIEKVKKVSKTSFEHLAKHANLITHVPDEEGKMLTPDELYIVEKLNDYAVYENRFLYMLLVYLQDFISFRMDKIEELRSTYIGDFKVKKDITVGKRELKIETSIYEKREDNPFPIVDDQTEKMISRIKDCATVVVAMINTPLMTEVAKSPLLKPPITKTNVLKMNNNFKNSLALYEYVSSYKGLGYTFEEVKTELHPLNDKNSDELADSLALTSFLTYKIGNDIEKVLDTTYQAEEREKKYEEERKLDEKIARMKKKAMESGRTMEEYMALLETRNQQLLHDSEELQLARNEILKLNQEIDRLNSERKELERRIDELKDEIEEKIREISRLNQKYIEDMMALRRQHAENIKKLKMEYEEKIALLKEDYEREIETLNENHKIEIQELNDSHQAELDRIDEEHNCTIEDLVEKHNLEVESLKNKIKGLNDDVKNTIIDRDNRINEYEIKIKSIISDCNSQVLSEKEISDKLVYERDLYKGELNALRVMNGTLAPCDEFATRERFNELSKEFEAFERFFNKEWKLVKKLINKEAQNKNSEMNKKLDEEEKEKQRIVEEMKTKLEEENAKDETKIEDVIDNEEPLQTEEDTKKEEVQNNIEVIEKPKRGRKKIEDK